MHAVEHDENGLFSLSSAYAVLTQPSLTEACGPCHEFLGGIYKKLPHFLAETKYQNPSDPNHTSVQKAYIASAMPFMDILTAHPHEVQGFATLMSVWVDGFNQLATLLPTPLELVDRFDDTISDVMFVDVGGGFGQKAIAFRRAFPHLRGRVVVQDLASAIDAAPKDDDRYHNIEMTVHDFTTEQPVKAARCLLHSPVSAQPHRRRLEGLSRPPRRQPFV